MTADRAAIRARWEAATPGPWRVDEWSKTFDVGAATLHVAQCLHDPRGEADAEAIAHAPTDVAALLADLDAAEALLREAFNVIDSTHARAYNLDVLPVDHGTVTYCYACEFAAKLGKFLGLTLNYDCPAARRA